MEYDIHGRAYLMLNETLTAGGVVSASEADAVFAVDGNSGDLGRSVISLGDLYGDGADFIAVGATRYREPFEPGTDVDGAVFILSPP